MKSVITITEHAIICNLCGKHLKSLSNHMLSHGYDNIGKRISRSQRLALYGLPAGSRLAIKSLRQHMSDVTSRDPKHPCVGGAQRTDRMVPLEGWSRFGPVRFRNPPPCLTCGKVFKPKHRDVNTKYCSQECAGQTMRISQEDLERIKKMRASGRLLKEIGDEFGVPYQRVQKWLRKYV